MASFSGSKSETVGCGLARSREFWDDSDVRVLFMSLAISRINWARCCELVDPVMIVACCSCDWPLLSAHGIPKLGRETEALLASKSNSSLAREFSWGTHAALNAMLGKKYK